MEAMKSARKNDTEDVGSDLSEQIKAATKDSHVRAENTTLMLDYQKGKITLPQYKVFDDLQKMLSVTTTEAEDQSEGDAVKSKNMFPSLPSMQFTVAVCVALTTVGLGFYAL